MTDYKICMNNGEILEVTNGDDAGMLDIEALGKLRWLMIQTPSSKKVYVNIAQINRIEVIE